MVYDVFISYSTKDQKLVEAMSHYLEERNVRCFVAYRDIPPGKVWAAAIIEAIENSQMMIVVFSKAFNLSSQVDREIELCSEENKPILTFRIQNEGFAGAKKYYLKNINWIDAFPNPPLYFDSLYASVGKLIKINSSLADQILNTSNRTEVKEEQIVKLVIKYKVPFGLIGPDLCFFMDGISIGEGNYMKNFLLETMACPGVHHLEIKLKNPQLSMFKCFYNCNFDFYLPASSIQLLELKCNRITGRIELRSLIKID